MKVKLQLIAKDQQPLTGIVNGVEQVLKNEDGSIMYSEIKELKDALQVTRLDGSFMGYMDFGKSIATYFMMNKLPQEVTVDYYDEFMESMHALHDNNGEEFFIDDKALKIVEDFVKTSQTTICVISAHNMFQKALLEAKKAEIDGKLNKIK